MEAAMRSYRINIKTQQDGVCVQIRAFVSVYALVEEWKVRISHFRRGYNKNNEMLCKHVDILSWVNNVKVMKTEDIKKCKHNRGSLKAVNKLYG